MFPFPQFGMQVLEDREINLRTSCRNAVESRKTILENPIALKIKWSDNIYPGKIWKEIWGIPRESNSAKMDKCQLSGASFHGHLDTVCGEKGNPVSFSLFLTARAPICCEISPYWDLNAPSKIKSVVMQLATCSVMETSRDGQLPFAQFSFWAYEQTGADRDQEE